ncbi:MAG: phage tail tape measure protein, partial [Bacteroidales bacterium]
LQGMGKNVSILSKTMGGDSVAAANVLTTAMNQFQVSLDDPTKATKTMSDMMNVMSAAARDGSAELPQIQAALENTGMAAKMAGVSFEETNAAIQVLDKAGAEGAQGGIALRNALGRLSQGRFMPKETLSALKEAGVDVNALGDKSLKLSDRLRALSPILGDTALMSQLFGVENKDVGTALVAGVDQIDKYTLSITGTNAAQEQATIVMGSYAEKMSRMNAKFDDMKISFFNMSKDILPGLQAAFYGIQTLTILGTGINAIACVGETAYGKAIASRTKKMWNGVTAQWAMISSGGTWIGVAILAAFATKVFSSAVVGLGIAIYNIPGIGWILLGITLLVGLIKLLWDKSEKFRQVLFGIWEATKAVFYNIGVVIKAIWENVVKPVFMFFLNIWKVVIYGIVSAAKWLWDGLVAIFSAIGQFLYDWVIMPVWNGITWVIDGLVGFFAKAWTWISGVFGGVAGWLNTNLLEPIKGIFSQMWDFISGILDNIINALMKPIKWIKEIWNKVFPKDQFKDVSVAYKVGIEKGTESWNNSQKKKKQDEGGIGQMMPGKDGGIAPVSLPGAAGTKPTGNKSEAPTGKTDAISAGGSRSSNTTITIKNLIENIVFDGNLADKRADLEREVTSAVMRILAMAQASG